MKNYKLAIILLSQLISISSSAQDKVNFKVRHKPNRTYISVQDNQSTLTLTFSGESSIISELKSNGLSEKTIIEEKSKVSSITKTGSFNDKKEIPFSIDFKAEPTFQMINGKFHDARPNPMSNMKIKGKVDSNSKLKINSIERKDLNNELKAIIEKSLESLHSQIKFPDMPIGIGESFTQETPLTIPMAGVAAINIIITTEYKLLGFKKDLALFSSKQKIKLNMEAEEDEAEITASGEGQGKFIYQMSEHFITLQKTDITMNLSIDLGKLQIKSNNKATSRLETKIKQISR